MNKEDEVSQRLDDIMSALKDQYKSLFAIGLMVVGKVGCVLV